MIIKTTHEEIKSYWESRIYEGDIGCDWAEALTHCWRCGDTHKTNSLHRCHIIPAQVSGFDIPSNFVLLCRNCHAEAPSFDNDLSTIWNWIKRTHAETYDTYWFIRVLREFEIIFKCKPDLDKINFKKFLRKGKEICIHFGSGQRRISLASWAYTMKKSGA